MDKYTDCSRPRSSGLRSLLLATALLAAACSGNGREAPTPAASRPAEGVWLEQKTWVAKVDTGVPVTRPQDYRFRTVEEVVAHRVDLDPGFLAATFAATRAPEGPHLELIIERGPDRTTARFEIRGAEPGGPGYELRVKGDAGHNQTFALALAGETGDQSAVPRQQVVGFVLDRKIGIRIQHADTDYPAVLCRFEEDRDGRRITRFFAEE